VPETRENVAKTKNTPTPVNIYGRTYHLRGGGDEEYLAELAGHVDARMREVAGATGTADTLKVAILASLNIADDYFKARRGEDGSASDDVQKRLARMVTLLDEALAG
jgi:cell division protein ZapA